MKGNISLVDFINEVKAELAAAQGKGGKPFFELKEVKLEVSFGLDISGKAGAKLVVLSIGGESKAQQVHKVTLMLAPLPVLEPKQAPTPGEPSGPKSGGGGGGGGGLDNEGHGPLYAPIP